ncbi:Integrase [Arcticibacter svalbardensis MN12-7]|uniref:Integrase n=1 Tax=Arcticibacter svalbardensis MN12-7 TaxID=1150600 RepID=R9GZ24_9SPHI|nr:site-specific integrase [Arcticibacter svalbardensis]EOR94204.1 Integrase [Arcticibacter svalbardensis MN12-7]
MAKVTLRRKGISKGRSSLFLDYYPAIRHPDLGKLTRREFLKVYVFDKPRNELEKMHNRDTLALAENVRALRQIEIQNKRFDFMSDSKRQGNFIDYFKKIVNKKAGSNSDNWSMAHRYLISFAGKDLRFSDLTDIFCEDYRDYLLDTPGIGRREKGISNNTALSYYSKFRTVLKTAFKANLLSVNLYNLTEGIKEQETHRDFLSLEEFQKLADTPCSDMLIKRAAMFSGLTGLRFSDVKSLSWAEVRGTEGKHYLQFKQDKTQGAEHLPVSDQAISLLGKREAGDFKVFRGLRYSQVKAYLNKWMKKAGIEKNITFHSFRHTYATLQLASGTDIYTISKMLGHRNVKTTEIYVKIVDDKKIEAANRIKLIF